MGQEINQYTLERSIFGENDYYDIDYFDGSTYQSAKIKGSTIMGGITTSPFYTQKTNSTALTNTTTETSLFNGALSNGTLTIGANEFQVGETYRFKLGGILSSDANQDVQIRLNSGSTVLCASGVHEIETTTSKVFSIEIDFTIRAIGTTTVASVIGVGSMTYNQDSHSDYKGFNFIGDNTTTFDTTASNVLSVSFEWSTASASNSIQTKIAYLRKL
jgi:hypothetical protein